MLFNSFDFLIFFGFVFGVQWFLPHRQRNLFLLAASYFFYACWDWRFLSLILIASLVSYTCGQRISEHSDRTTKRTYLVLSLVINLGILGVFKYFGFFADSLAVLLRSTGVEVAPTALHIVLPVGISFYTFQALSYTIDIYRGESEPVHNLVDFLLYVAFFPQLVAGPIERSTHLLPQLTTRPTVSLADVSDGCWLMIWGLFKKAVIADNMSIIVGAAFGDTDIAGGDLLVGTYAFAIQIFADFSGYTDIARGAAKMLGYDLMLNFRMPYFATGPRDFWRRWHISLSTWLRDYLYIPLGGNRKGRLRMLIALAVTMILGGLWHGAAWTFVIWGCYHALLLVLASLGGKLDRTVSGSLGRLSGCWTVFKMVVTFHLVCFGWLIFRSESLADVGIKVQALFANFTFTEYSCRWLWSIGFLCWPLLSVQTLQAVSRDVDAVAKLSVFSRTVLYASIVVMLITMGKFGEEAFIYFQF